MADLPGESSEQPAAAAPRSRRLMRGLGLLLLLLAGLLAWYLAILYFGWQSGQAILEEKQQADFAQQVEHQVSLARENIEQGSYSLALRRLEWVLERVPDHAEALLLRQQAQSALDVALTPEIVSQPSLTPSPRPSPTQTPPPIEDPELELERLSQLVDDEEWEEAVSALVAFQWQFPSYARQRTDTMLYNAYIGLGLELVQGDQVELGLAYLDQAQRLGDLPESVTDYRTWAQLYLQGIAFYNVNWAATIYYFRDLCLAAPFYHSSCERLHEALIAFGDQYAASRDWCPAQSLYEEALEQGRSQALVEKLTQAREACLAATPTPTPQETPAIVDGTPITSTQPVTVPFIVVTLPSVPHGP